MNNTENFKQKIKSLLDESFKHIDDNEFKESLIGHILFKLGEVDEYKVTKPKKELCVPIINTLIYSWNNDLHKDIYIDLIIGLMNSHTQGSIHPRFVEIIKQLSDFEVKVLKYIYKVYAFNIMNLDTISIPTVNIIFKNKSTFKENLVLRDLIYIPFIKESDYDIYCIAINNLISLNLIETNYKNFLEKDFLYEKIKNSDLFTFFKNLYNKKNNNNNEFIVQKGILELTNLGKSLLYTIN
ncbi:MULTISPECIES: Abi-alpha family protein [Bacillota]|uniref:DUF4393 domain-containing protein n=2 Tax=Bacillota TaxID=1239 RepID=A0A9X3XUL3_ENTFC|nr:MULTISPECIES: Abi-alpha family protein [Bacillota]MDC4242497.1 DUF4393 domain-containing protein [Clostridium tertium]MDC4246161.1 DUF4393 domain-containing protein [Clostridium perfringens]MDC4249072.1 DUF4393 domain-containing protein [Enterococcus faecium]